MPRPMRLPGILDSLESVYGRPAPSTLTDPFALILWENVAYLVDDQRREAAFKALESRVGLTPEAIRAAEPSVLREVAALGGMLAHQRVAKLLVSAEVALEYFGGDLQAALHQPETEAKKALKRFPGIGDPGAEKILLFSHSRPLLALESNGLRVLLRLGYGEEKKSYDATYRAVQAAVEPELRKECPWLIRAHRLLRRHGQELCRRSRPRCGECPLTGVCAYYQQG